MVARIWLIEPESCRTAKGICQRLTANACASGAKPQIAIKLSSVGKVMLMITNHTKKGGMVHPPDSWFLTPSVAGEARAVLNKQMRAWTLGAPLDLIHGKRAVKKCRNGRIAF